MTDLCSRCGLALGEHLVSNAEGRSGLHEARFPALPDLTGVHCPPAVRYLVPPYQPSRRDLIGVSILNALAKVLTSRSYRETFNAVVVTGLGLVHSRGDSGM